MWIYSPPNLGFDLRLFEEDNNIILHEIHVSQIRGYGPQLGQTTYLPKLQASYQNDQFWKYQPYTPCFAPFVDFPSKPPK
jgi:hypothetical protein